MRVLLGVSGGIAAFKAPLLVRRLRERSHDVRCVLTRAGAAFVTPLTLEILSGRAVHREEYLEPSGSGEEGHIEASRWAEAMCVAPATANTLARLSLGLADDFLTTTALAFRGPMVLAPAMHREMWEQEVVRSHVAALEGRGALVLGPQAGALASGEWGMGRMAEPEAIVAALEGVVAGGPLRGRTVVVSAGPTREPLDPVRFLSNRSSGRMGFALAREAARRGARTVLVAGPVDLQTPPGVERVDVATAGEMRAALRQWSVQADLVLMAAAVADFAPLERQARKLKKEDGVPRLELTATPDILSELPSLAPHAVVVGFAAETEDLDRRARGKLASKGVDFIVANDVSRGDIGFDSESNEVTVFHHVADPVFLSRRPKHRLAADLLDLFSRQLGDREPRPATADC